MIRSTTLKRGGFLRRHFGKVAVVGSVASLAGRAMAEDSVATQAAAKITERIADVGTLGVATMGVVAAIAVFTLAYAFLKKS